MSYLYVVAVIVLLYAVMHFFTEMTHRQKLSVASAMLLVIAAALVYNHLTDASQEHVRAVILKFNQHQTLECGGRKVDDKSFTLSVGTQSFIANQGTPYAGQIINASGCR
jgi:ADP-ribosylglycohydrolase